MLILARAAIFATAWLIFESVISWAAFCDHPQERRAEYQSAEEYKCIFIGPLVSILL
jgi:hypothetical protein